MLDVSFALETVLEKAKRLPAEVTAVMSTALGQILATSVPSDMDSPPFDKALMDGYAVRAVDVSEPCELEVIEEVPAGAVPKTSVNRGQAVRLYTGAPMPTGADAVVIREKSTLVPPNRVRLSDTPTCGQHVLKKGTEMTVGQTVLPAGSVLTPAAFGLLATVGRTTISAYPRPRVSVLATGNELVEPNMKPGPGQIRNSNGPMLVAQTARAGGLPRYLGIARDDAAVLRSFIREGLNTSQILVLAGGVSAGDFDLVPAVLAELGVVPHFHHVKMKPGKPLYFGTKGDVLVFGLPGNPLSSFVGFELFVHPAIRRLAGHPDPGPRRLSLTLSEPLRASNNRPTYHPGQRQSGGRIRGLDWFGSADLRAMLAADALIVLPPGDIDYPAGTTVPAIPLTHTRKDVV